MKPFPLLRAYLWPGLAIVLFSIVLLWSARELADDREVINAGATSGSWGAVQAEIEYLRFLSALDQHGHGEPKSDEQMLQQRFDIFWSRLPLLLEGNESEHIRTIPGVPELIESLLATLEAIEPKFHALKPGDEVGADELRAVLAPFGAELHEFTRVALLDVQADFVEDRVGRATTWTVAGFIGLMLSGAVLIVLFVRQIRTGDLLRRAEAASKDTAETANRRLTALTRELERAVAERMKTEAALRDSEARFRALAANLPGMIVQRLTKSDGGAALAYVSDGARPLLGCDPSEFLDGQKLASMIHPDDRDRFLGLLGRSARTLEPADTEMRVVDQSGEVKWLRTAVRSRRLESGDVLSDSLSIDITAEKRAEDDLRSAHGELEARVEERTAELGRANHALKAEIAERSRAEEALRETETRLSAIASSAPIIAWAVDRDGIVTLSEGAGLERLGTEPGAHVGQSLFDLYRGVPKANDSVRRALAGEEFVETLDVRGAVFTAVFRPVRNSDGDVEGALGVALDVT